MSPASANIDPREVARFDALATRWWDPHGECKPLHDINPVRLEFIARHATLSGSDVVDVGCGGGILSEALARRGARVTGIDMAGASLTVARLHLNESGLDVDYHQATAEDYATARPGAFDIVTCMELIEHVPHPLSLVNACAALVRPGGHVFFSTINRNPKAYLLAVIGAEYLLHMLPQGTHDYRRFVRPSELSAWCRRAGLALTSTAGMRYHPLTRRFSLYDDVDVNYLACFRSA